MGTLAPFFNQDQYVLSRMHTTGYPNSTSGAIYSSYGGWGFFPIFKNTTENIIKLNSLTLGASIYNGGAIGQVYFADLGANLLSTVRVTPQSEEFSIPGGSNCQNLTVALNSTVVINPNSYFLLGVKIWKNDNRHSYINISCDFLNSSQNPFYTARDLSTAKNIPFNVVRVDTSRSPWDRRIPHMTIDYSDYKITPVLSDSTVRITQGQTTSIHISGYSDWSIGTVKNPSWLSLSKNGDYLNITANYFDSANQVSTDVTINGLNSNVTLTVQIDMPSITDCKFSSAIIRPTESVNVISKTSDNLIPTIVSVSNSGAELLGVNGGHIICGKITSSLSGWGGNANRTFNPQITLRHPYNKLITATFSGPQYLTAKHFSSNDINVTLSSYSIFNIEGIKIYVTDSTQIVGGSQLKNYDSSFTYADNVLTLLNNIDPGNKIIYAYLVNDCVVTKNITINVKQFVRLSVTPNNNNTRLALFCYKESDKIRLSPYSYPIRLMYPSTYGAISRNGISRKDIVIEKLSFGYINGDNEYITLDSQYEDSVFWVSKLLNASPSTEKDYLLVFGMPDFTLTNSDLLNTHDLDSKLQTSFKVSYYNDAINKEVTLSVVIKLEKYLNRIITFETNKYSNGTDIPGSVFKKPINKMNVDSFLPETDCGINQLFSPAQAILVNYFNQGVSRSQLINAEQYSSISNTNDKLLVESLLSYIDSLNKAVNIDSGLRILKPVRSKIAIGKPIMWDDSLEYTADGRPNISELDSTASPWKELYNAIKNIQYMKKYRICFKDNNIVYKVKQKVANNTYDIMAWR